MYASRLTHLALLHVHQDPTDKIIWSLTICSSWPSEHRESLWQKGGIILKRAVCSVCLVLSCVSLFFFLLCFYGLCSWIKSDWLYEDCSVWSALL